MKWLESESGKWPVRVVDMSGMSKGLLFTSSRKTAENGASFGSEDGLCFTHDDSPEGPEYEVNLSYRTEGRLCQGVLFNPEFDQKWAVYFYNDKIYFVQSWQREVRGVARVESSDERLHVTSFSGNLFGEEEHGTLTSFAIDFIMRSHALNQLWPAPFPRDLADRLVDAANWCLHMYGNRARIITCESMPSSSSIGPLRTDTLLHIAAARGNIKRALDLITDGHPTEVMARDGSTPLHWAVFCGQNEMLDLLIENGTPVDTPSEHGVTSLMDAIVSKHHDKVPGLLKHGADVNAVDNRGFTCLHRAAHGGHGAMVDLLLDEGALANVEAAGKTPAKIAMENGHLDIANRLIKKSGS